MSVLGELTRHLDEFLRLVGGIHTPAARTLVENLTAARPERAGDLTEAASAILDVLERTGAAESALMGAPEELSAEVAQAAETLARLARIVLGH